MAARLVTLWVAALAMPAVASADTPVAPAGAATAEPPSPLAAMEEPPSSLATTEEPPPSLEGTTTDQPLAEPGPRYRKGKGWFLGGSLGTGVAVYKGSNSESFTSTFVEARFGGMLSPQYALSVELWSDGHYAGSFDEMAAAETTIAVALSYWLTPRIWLRTGLGSATLRVFENGLQRDQFDALCVLLGGGYELFHRDSFSLDGMVRFTRSGYDFDLARTTISFSLGLNWY